MMSFHLPLKNVGKFAQNDGQFVEKAITWSGVYSVFILR